jgi:uncharacterized phiE125 gp8 family phage protein
MTPLLLIAPAIEPVSLGEAKAWLRLDTDDEDDLVQALLVSARLTLEAYTRRFFVTQSWRLVFDAWARAQPRVLAVPLAPLASVAAIRVYDANDAAQTLAPQSYRAPPAPAGGRIVFLADPPAPARRADGIEIDVVVGYGPRASDTPEPLRRAILALVANWHENRGDGQAASAVLPAPALALARPFRRERLA